MNLSRASSSELLEISDELNLALSSEDMEKCKEFFSDSGRSPTDVELQTIAQTWSEHCYHRTFKGKILMEDKEVELFKDYIKKATGEISAPWCVSVFEDNAGIVKFDENRSVAAKVETHNHPSAIDPFGGAATGIGGVIRDILGVWARPIANTDVLCFGPLDFKYDQLPEGTKHPKYLFQGVVEGIGHYGNNMGIPTVNGAICFDEGYLGNVVVYCGCIGTLPTSSYIKNPEPGDIVVLAGGKTGRDGIHGVTFASEELTEKSEEADRPAVQIPNPIEEEKLRRAILRIRERGLGKAITDLGGGGLSSAVGETAHDANCGATIDLDKVPLKHANMSPWEIWISESQERMLLAIEDENLQSVLEIFESEEVEAVAIGKFTEDGDLKSFYREHPVVDLDLDFLFNPPKTSRKAEWKKPELVEPDFSMPENLEKVLLNLLSSPNICSKESVVRTYDHEVQGNTILKPLQGEHSGPNNASVLKPFEDSSKGIVISSGIKPSYGKIDPYWMAASAIEEAVRNNISAGGRRISLLDNFTWGNPEKPQELGKLVRACRACYDFAKSFETPFISGKDSLYNESPVGPVTPTLLITAVGIIPEIEKTISMEVKEEKNPLYLIGATYPELGGSEYYRSLDHLGKTVPQVRPENSKKKFDLITKAVDKRQIRACHDLSDGGLGVAISEMAFTGGLGLELDLRKVPGPEINREDFLLFSESNGRFLIEVPENKTSKIEKMFENCAISRVGKVTGEKNVSITGLEGKEIINSELSKLRKAWKGGLDPE
ncbi:hypothetical protein AKJ62_01205 [candidate division MSBL1 archaeon SCGC-AAA259D14]|uniref:Phosphoribosylformylglycinamidine synthase subunit PurL n=1 Tax=candidate division MSBL1 archaeon SCGC-AAA259D14 TaxID=1698261 RepID=A0A133U7Z5_9EURY|nr:hypothetical protein AKJ62_01205 [candidate division MSBL1 archaeon SCGC-AAA259D14]